MKFKKKMLTLSDTHVSYHILTIHIPHGFLYEWLKLG